MLPRCSRPKTLLLEEASFATMYVVRAGLVALYPSTRDGREQVLGYRGPREQVGLDALSAEAAPYSAETIRPSELCAIPLASMRAARPVT